MKPGRGFGVSVFWCFGILRLAYPELVEGASLREIPALPLRFPQNC